MEITGFEDTAKRLLTTALPENRPPNRNRGFSVKTEPKPTDLGQCETVTTLAVLGGLIEVVKWWSITTSVWNLSILYFSILHFIYRQLSIFQILPPADNWFKSYLSSRSGLVRFSVLQPRQTAGSVSVQDSGGQG